MKASGETPPVDGGAERPACSRVEATYQQLKRDIIDGVYTPRQRLIETEIAAAPGGEPGDAARRRCFGCNMRVSWRFSRTVAPRCVPSASKRQRASCRCARCWKGLPPGSPPKRRRPAELAELHDIVAEMENTLAADDLLGHLPLVGRFHQCIIEIAGNEFIDQFLGCCGPRSFDISFASFSSQGARTSRWRSIARF